MRAWARGAGADGETEMGCRCYGGVRGGKRGGGADLCPRAQRKTPAEAGVFLDPKVTSDRISYCVSSDYRVYVKTVYVGVETGNEIAVV